MPVTDPTTPETGCPTFGAVSPRLRWDSATLLDEPPVTDLVHDPELGSIAPGPEPDPRPEGPMPHPTPLLTPAPAMPASEENLRRWNRAVAKLKHTIDLDAAANPEHVDLNAAAPPSHPRSPHNPFRMLDHTPKTQKDRPASPGERRKPACGNITPDTILHSPPDTSS